jgi:RNA polymerase sigma-32 factor
VSDNSAEWGRYRCSTREHPFLAADEERELLSLAQRGDKAAMRRLIQSHLRLVVKLASRQQRPGLCAHDLYGEGVLGLMEAIRRFREEEGARFSTYASWWVSAYARQHALANRRIVRAPASRGARVTRAKLRCTERTLTQQLGRTPTLTEVSCALGVLEQDVLTATLAMSARDVSLTEVEGSLPYDPPDESPTPEQAVSEAEQRARLERSVAHLDDRERVLVHEQLSSQGNPSLAEWGRRLGVSRQRASQILTGARSKLRARLEDMPGLAERIPVQASA